MNYMKEHHLDFILRTIEAMRNKSFFFKGVASLFVCIDVFIHNLPLSTAFVLMILIAFCWFKDTFFLRQEKMYRLLYDYIRLDDSHRNPYTMDASIFSDRTPRYYRLMMNWKLSVYYLSLMLLIGLTNICCL